jgi:hypothetical protein
MTDVKFGFPAKEISKWIIVFAALSTDTLHGQQGPAKTPDTSPHKVQFLSVDKDVKLEVLDWGGTAVPWSFWRVRDSMLMYSISSHSNLHRRIMSTALSGAALAHQALPRLQMEITPQIIWATMSWQ